MQNDLISRSALLESLNAINYKVQMPESHVNTVKKVLNVTFEQFEKTIKEQPTTYDVDKVVAKLEKGAFTDEYGDYSECEKLIVLDEAIDIVRNGGKE